jgi:8-oxo-dGTP diphosphatase
MGQTIQRVGIAVVEHDGRYLVGTRRINDVLGGHAEFPGGKCLPNESAAACAVRECLEETGLAVTAMRLMHACRHTYPHGPLDLEFWLCQPDAPKETVAGSGYEWLTAKALKSLPFPEANRSVIEQIVTRSPSAS